MQADLHGSRALVADDASGVGLVVAHLLVVVAVLDQESGHVRESPLALKAAHPASPAAAFVSGIAVAVDRGTVDPRMRLAVS
ncbi:hypothetical protein [Streptomyces sp. NPDC001978]|uniref:hypothetical protein n=1 Tax=Streptomyces sp. NPDC001978 TaxID=3364627 RepID=UPI0036B62B39